MGFGFPKQERAGLIAPDPKRLAAEVLGPL